VKSILLAFLFCLTLPVFCANAQSKPDLAPAEGDKLTYDVVVYGDSSGAAVAAILVSGFTVKTQTFAKSETMKTCLTIKINCDESFRCGKSLHQKI
jgi:hypothetical protein